MLILYSLPNSQDCLDVQATLYELGVKYENKIATQAIIFRELRELTGRDYTPVLYDSVKKIILVEKDVIINFLKEKFEEDRYKGLY